MNRNTISAECGHGMHTACTFESCACGCHLDFGEEDFYDQEFDDEEPA